MEKVRLIWGVAAWVVLVVVAVMFLLGIAQIDNLNILAGWVAVVGAVVVAAIMVFHKW